MQQALKILIIVVAIILVIVLISRSTRRETVEVQKNKKKKQGIILKLLPPQEITASNDNGTVTIKWREPNGAKSYILYYSDKPDFVKETARTIGSITGEEFEISKVPAGRYYCYMTSISGGRESEPSPMVTFDVTICEPPRHPDDFTSRVVSFSTEGMRVAFSWKPEPTLDGYVIRVNSGTPPFGHERDHLIARIEDPVTANYIIDGLDPSLHWYAKISSVASHCGEGHMSPPLRLNQ